MRALFLVLILALPLPLLSTEETMDDEMRPTDRKERFEVYQPTNEETMRGGMDEIIEIAMNESDIDREIQQWLISIRKNEIPLSLSEQTFSLFDSLRRFLIDVTIFFVKNILIHLFAIVLLTIGIVLTFIHNLNVIFSRWNSRRQNSFMKRWPLLVGLVSRSQLRTRIRDRYNEIQSVHRANCLLCCGRQDAFRCRSMTMTTENARFDVNVNVEGENRTIDVIGPVNGYEEGRDKSVADRLQIPHLSQISHRPSNAGRNFSLFLSFS